MNHHRFFAKEFKALMSTQSKVKNKKTHYETLKLPQSSTQEDIKTAYYKLSKEYHPDVNKSKSAKKQFQELSDAYNVIGNYTKRKLYDRDLMARAGKTSVKHTSFNDPDQEDKISEMYQKSSDDILSESQKFGMDEWVQDYYKTSLSKRLELSNKKMFLSHVDESEKIQNEIEYRETNAIVGIVTLIAFAIYIRSIFSKNVTPANNQK